MEIKWTNGLPFERSKRRAKEEDKKTNETNAQSNSLNYDENTWEMLNQTLAGEFKVSNKREELGDRLAGREMMQQIGFNPFLGESNYIDHVSIQDKFLKPVNTTQNDN